MRWRVGRGSEACSALRDNPGLKGTGLQAGDVTTEASQYNRVATGEFR